MRVLRLPAILPVLALCFATSAIAQPFYRWSSAPAFTCTASGGLVNVVFASQPAEWDAPAGTQFTINYISNGVLTPSGPFPVPTPPGSFVFAALAVSAPSYPASVTVRLDTLASGGVVVYQSSLSASCGADGGGPSTVTNGVPAGIPALGPFGLILLSAALGFVGLAVMWTRRGV